MSIEERAGGHKGPHPALHHPRPYGHVVLDEGSAGDSNRSHHPYGRIVLWVCLWLALLIRVWLVARTSGVIDGDEVLVGVQAEHILRGELPIYFYGQPYMGSLEAYLVALIVAIAGPSAWTLRAEPVLLSLVVVWLTWKLAAALADAAKLPSFDTSGYLPPRQGAYARLIFMSVAVLIAAIPPLYDGILELRTYGGYSETFILMLLLLLSAQQLTRRWHEGASRREIALRWAGIGLIVGLGFWIYPLIISAVLAAAAWIAGDRLLEAARQRREIVAAPGRYIIPALKGSVLALAAIPAGLLGFAPALYWGAAHQWQNISYILGLGVSASRYASIRQVTRSYITCVAPRVISGAVPKEAPLLALLHSPLLVVGGLCMFASAALVGIALLSQHPLLLRLQRLVTLPLLFGACTALIFCTSKASVYVVISCNYDIAGRYATPLVLALPFFFAAVFTVASMFVRERSGGGGTAVEDGGAAGGNMGFGESGATEEDRTDNRALNRHQSEKSPSTSVGRPPWLAGLRWPSRSAGQTTRAHPTHPNHPRPYGILGWRLRVMPIVTQNRAPARGAPTMIRLPDPSVGRVRLPMVAQGILFVSLLAYAGMQVWTYGLTDPGRTFQSAYCLEAPASNEPIIAYLQQEHVSYAWASNWLAYGIVFKTNGSIVAADPLPFLPRSPNIDRVPANTRAVRHADRPALLVFVHRNDTHPLLLQYLDGQRVTYRAARFPSQPGIDVLVVTPLSRTVSPFESAVFQNIFTSCND